MAETSIFKTGKRLQWMLVSLIFLLTGMCYWRTVHADFLKWDDDINIYLNPHLKGLSPKDLYWMFTDFEYMRRYVPLAWLGWGINYELAGLNPLTYHLGNVLFQCLNAILVFFLIQKLLRAGARETVTPEKEKAILMGAAVGALLWAIHPLRVETVAWASGRIYIQALMFLLAGALSYLKYATLPPEAKARRRYYWVSVAALAASLLTYPIGLGFVPVLLILDFYPLRRFNPGVTGLWDANARRIWLEKVPYVMIAGLLLGVTFWASAHSSGIWKKPVSLEEFGLGSRVMQGFYIWAYYAWKFWVPFNLSPIYTTLVSFEPADEIFVTNAAFVVSLTVLLFWKRRTWPLGLTLWLCHLVLLVPMLGLTEHPHIPSDRYNYIPGIAWSILVAAGVAHFWHAQKLRLFTVALSTVGLGCLGWLSFQQTNFWQNSVTLFERVLAKLGDDPYRADIHWRLGDYLLEHGQLEGARHQYTEVLKLWPDFTKGYVALADILAAQGRQDEALVQYTELVRLNPDLPIIYMKIGVLQASQGKIPQAIEAYQTALQKNPDIPMALNNLAWILATTEDAKFRNGTQAVQYAERACELLKYQEAFTVGTLAAAYAEAGRFKEAVEMARKASTLALASGQTNLVAANKKLLEEFLAGRPHREPASKTH